MFCSENHECKYKYEYDCDYKCKIALAAKYVYYEYLVSCKFLLLEIL